MYYNIICSIFSDVNATERRRTGAAKSSRFKCHICPNKFYKQKHNLNVHLRKHASEKPFKFPERPKRFVIKASVGFLPDERPFECEDCQKRFKTMGALQVHVLTHATERNFKCDLCPQAFLQPSGLKSHRDRGTFFRLRFQLS